MVLTDISRGRSRDWEVAVLQRVWANIVFVLRILRVLRAVRSVQAKAGYGYLMPDVIEKAVDAHGDKVAFYFEGRALRYDAFDGLANRIAHWGLKMGLKPGDCVALFMPNRPDYVAVWYGLSKIGVITALINNQLVGESLAHCVKVGACCMAIVDGELADVYAEAETHLDVRPRLWRWDFDGAAGDVDGGVEGDETAPGEDLGAVLAVMGDDRPDPAVRAHINAREPALRLYTSGTTGLPKAANVTHLRGRNYMLGFGATVAAKASDRMMLALPLYHATGGLCGVGCALLHGGAVILAKKFSASGFWDLAVEHGATQMIYVGEMCRFLTTAPPHPREKDNSIRVAIGNGLRPDVWPSFVERFGIPWVLEFYGATEGNVSLLNLDGTEGAVGRIPPLLASRFNARIVRYDYDIGAPVRGDDGLCVPAAHDEVGEMLGEIREDDARFRFEGYAGKREDTNKKILSDVFKPGDRWFRTGDLMRMDARGYIYFVDRAGDTFRWKSENVATSEVAEAISRFDGVDQANVYGVAVPGYDGKAGMAAVVVRPDVDFAALAVHLKACLPPYARPVFLRVVDGGGDVGGDENTTGTFKFQKKALVEQGYDLSVVTDRILVADGEVGFRPLDSAMLDQIRAGEARF